MVEFVPTRSSRFVPLLGTRRQWFFSLSSPGAGTLGRCGTASSTAATRGLCPRTDEQPWCRRGARRIAHLRYPGSEVARAAACGAADIPRPPAAAVHGWLVFGLPTQVPAFGPSSGHTRDDHMTAYGGC